MTIDGRSLLAVVAALCVVFSLVVLALERRIRQPMPGLRLWAFSNLFLGVAAAAHMLQGHVPMWVPAIVGNWTMLVGRSTSVAALRQFDHLPVPRVALATACGVLMLGIAATLFWPEPRARAMIMVGGMAALAGWATYSLAVGAPPSVSRALTMVGMGGWGLANVWRLWTTANLPEGAPVLDLHNPTVAAYLGALVIMDVLCNVGFVLLITDRMHEWVLQLARTDHLTGALSRGALYTQATRDLHIARRQRTHTAAFIVDIDRFKTINDGHGHAAGDAVLRHVAQHGQAVLRCTDLFGRYGGDEFVAILPETDLHTAATIAERLRVAVGEPVPGALPLPCGLACVTVSIGVASVAPGCTAIDDLIAQADQALYEAKNAGRNRTRITDDEAAAPASGKASLRVIQGRP
jgi:diguanylate cyclase (GGDEF)-like protein